MIPEPDGSFQEIDMVVLTEYLLFVFEIKNRNCTMNIEHWSDSKCTIDGEPSYSPIMQNEKHITALRNYLNNDDRVNNSPAIVGPVMGPVSIIFSSPYANVNISHDYDEWDEFSMESTQVFLSNGYCVTAQLNDIINQCMTSENNSRIDVESVYNALLECCTATGEQKSMSMRYRDEYSENSLKHPWEYYACKDTERDSYAIIRTNGVYTQEYSNFCFWYSWQFIDQEYSSRFRMKKLNGIKKIIQAKNVFDEKYTLEEFFDEESEKAKTVVDYSQGDKNMEIKFCGKCGAKAESGNYCKYCGSKL